MVNAITYETAITLISDSSNLRQTVISPLSECRLFGCRLNPIPGLRWAVSQALSGVRVGWRRADISDSVPRHTLLPLCIS
jgi:hypothetical protein